MVLKFLSILIMTMLTHITFASSITLPEEEGYLWKWNPFRMAKYAKDAIVGKDQGIDFWRTNSTFLNTELAEFKAATTSAAKTNILQKVMTQSADAYKKAVREVEKDYRPSMSYIIKQFQNDSPDATILYLHDNNLVSMYKNDAPDEEKAAAMVNLLKQADAAVKAKNKPILPPPGTAQTTAAAVAPIPPVS